MKNSLPLPVITLRSATMKDAEQLFLWRNDPIVREASHSSTVITLEEHMKWLSATLLNSDAQLYIAEENGFPVGTIRANYSDNAWTLSWTVASVSRGRNIGKSMVALLAGRINGVIKAEVKADNIASIHIATYAGLVLQQQHNGVLYFQNLPKIPT